MMGIQRIIAAAAMLAAIGMAVPASAASTASCREELTHDVDGNIVGSVDQNAPTILASLRDKGINAVSVQGWGGCVRADVVQPNGKTSTEFFDPNTLQRLEPNG